MKAKWFHCNFHPPIILAVQPGIELSPDRARIVWIRKKVTRQSSRWLRGTPASWFRSLRDSRDWIKVRIQTEAWMRWPVCTSTGVVEAGCKVVIGTKLKRAGMHWTL